MWRGDLKKPQSLYEEAPSWIFIKFSAKWCTVLHLKKKNDQNSSIWRKLATFCANYHVLGFSSSFRRKVWDFAKSHQSSSIWLKLAILRTTMFQDLPQVFSKKLQEVWDFVEPSKLIDLPETSHFSFKLPCFRIFLKFSVKSCKKCGLL